MTSERARARLVLALLASAALALPGCHRSRTQPLPAASATLAPVAPRELLVEGALRRPSETWPRLRELLGGSAGHLPRTFPLAVTTLIGASPLVAGLVDERAPVALAVVGDPSGVSVLGGIGLTSGVELVAAIATGRDARFRSERDPEHGLTLLIANGALGGMALGVVGDTLVLAQTREALLLAASYVARTLGPSLGEEEGGESVALVARKAALAGPLSASLRDRCRTALHGLDVADRASRLEHGRPPDFGDPAAVIEALAGFTDQAVAVLSTAEEIRASAALSTPIPEISIELIPEPTGAAKEWIQGAVVGDALPLLALPMDTDSALLVHRSPPNDGPPATPSVVAILGDRLRATDRARLGTWLEDVERGVGTPAVLGVLGGAGGPTPFVLGTSGNEPALRRAVSALPRLLDIPALASPLHAFVGTVEARPVARLVPAPDSVALRLRMSAPQKGGSESATMVIDVVEAAALGRVAVTAGRARSSTRVLELVKGATDGIGTEPIVARAVARAGAHSVGLALARLRDDTGRAGWAALGVGSDHDKAWMDVTMSELGARVLLGSPISP